MARGKTKTVQDLLAVELVEGDKSKKEHAFYWHIYADAVRAGQVYIDMADDAVLGNHPSIHIFLNKKSQGKGIGKRGYAMACEKSGLSKIFAHMRKSNLPSKHAALAAGFKEVEDERFTQLVLVWERLPL